MTCSLPETLRLSVFLLSPHTSSAGCSASDPVCGSYVSLLTSQTYLSRQHHRKGRATCGWRGRWGSEGPLHPPHHPSSLGHVARAPQLRTPNRVLPQPSAQASFPYPFPKPEKHQFFFVFGPNKVTCDLAMLFKGCLLCGVV